MGFGVNGLGSTHHYMGDSPAMALEQSWGEASRALLRPPFCKPQTKPPKSQKLNAKLQQSPNLPSAGHMRRGLGPEVYRLSEQAPPNPTPKALFAPFFWPQMTPTPPPPPPPPPPTHPHPPTPPPHLPLPPPPTLPKSRLKP